MSVGLYGQSRVREWLLTFVRGEPLWPVLGARRRMRLVWLCWCFRGMARLIVEGMGSGSSPTRAGPSWEIHKCLVNGGVQLLGVKVIKGPSRGTLRYSSESIVYYSNVGAGSLDRGAWNVDSALWSVAHDTCPVRKSPKRQVLHAQETIVPDQINPALGPQTSPHDTLTQLCAWDDQKGKAGMSVHPYR